MSYDFVAIEKRWQERWERERTFRIPNPGEADFDPTRPKYYVLDMFPYPSGSGLHVGHPLGYIATDVVARYKRMRGFNVLHPMGFDAFGLPAEQYAVETGVHPRLTTEANIKNITAQLKLLGLGYDWDRSFATIEPRYYKWTQWIFLQLYHSWFDPTVAKARPIAELERALAAGERRVDADGTLVGAHDAKAVRWDELDAASRRQLLDRHRLAYMDEVSVNWCPGLGTVLANEEVTSDGRSERGNFPVFQRPLRQWMMRITAYADRLDRDLSTVSWPESLVAMQRNWIGRSEGAHIDFAVVGKESSIRVYTTRPDTLFGATYMVLAPEHPLLESIVSDAQATEVRAYQAAATAKDAITRQSEAAAGKKSGVFTGAFAINPVTHARIPIWVADYVLMGYGTGAIMAVPGHDQRDFDFARHFGIKIAAVVLDATWLREAAKAAGWPESGDAAAEVARYGRAVSELPTAFAGMGIAINSSGPELTIDGLETSAAKAAVIAWLESSGRGKRTVQYKLRDWLFSRQRYWGEPFPILHGPDGEIVPLDESALPVELPAMDDFRPTASDDPLAPPRPPLGRAPESWRMVERAGVRYTRELNTMPNWAGSCWYYLRYLSPHDRDHVVSPAAERYWMSGGGVDLYVGGVEHAVLHLLYARFWHKVLFDLGYTSTVEPFKRLFNQGYILAALYRDARGMTVPADEVEERDGAFYYQGQSVTREFGKMGKSLKNAIAPDEFCAEFGADTLRLYLMYLGPLDRSYVWSTSDVLGVHRFLQRLWRNLIDDRTDELRVSEDAPDDALLRLLHKTIKTVTANIEAFDFNTAIARLIELNNELVSLKSVPRRVAEPLLAMLNPLAPHFAAELWERLGHRDNLAFVAWPSFDPALTVDDTIEFPVQINGKLRSRIFIAPSADDNTIERLAREDEKVRLALAGKTVRKVIVVRGRLVNLVIG